MIQLISDDVHAYLMRALLPVGDVIELNGSL